jgi:hypothetical protein
LIDRLLSRSNISFDQNAPNTLYKVGLSHVSLCLLGKTKS